MMAVVTNINGVNGLEFHWAGSEKNFIQQFNQVDIILENEEIISFREEALSESIYQFPWYFNSKLFKIDNDSTWAKLKTTPLKNFRISVNGKELFTREIDKKMLNL